VLDTPFATGQELIGPRFLGHSGPNADANLRVTNYPVEVFPAVHEHPVGRVIFQPVNERPKVLVPPLRVRPETSRLITEFSEHEAD
jgi:hypothetical protein